jgi:hypothetical protein
VKGTPPRKTFKDYLTGKSGEPPRVGPTVESWKDLIPQDLEELNPRSSGISQADLEGYALDALVPMGSVVGAVRKVGAAAAKPAMEAGAKKLGELIGKAGKRLRSNTGQADEAARLARMQEHFPIPVFHGTVSPTGIKQFRQIPGGAGWNDVPGPHVGTLEAATQRIEAKLGPKFEAVPKYNRKTQEELVDKMESAGSIMPLQMQMKKPFLDPKGNVFKESDFGKFVNQWAIDNGYFSKTLAEGDPLKNASYAQRREAAQRDFARQLLSEGYDVIPYINTAEDIGSKSYLVLDPTKLRSRFAKFDTKKLGSANLSAGLAGILGAGAMAKNAKRGEDDGSR